MIIAIFVIQEVNASGGEKQINFNKKQVFMWCKCSIA